MPWSKRGLVNLRKQNSDTLDTSLVLYRENVALASQSVSLRRVSQTELPDGVAIATPGGLLEIRGAFDLNVRSGDRFTWDGMAWQVTQTPIATQTGTSVARRAFAEATGKSSG